MERSPSASRIAPTDSTETAESPRMRRFKALGATLLVVGLALFPAIGATFELGAELGAIDRMHRAAIGPPTMEPIATYEVDPSTQQATMRIHSVSVRR